MQWKRNIQNRTEPDSMPGGVASTHQLTLVIRLVLTNAL